MKVEEINKITVVGAGLMGHGIAQEFAYAGYDASIHDLSAGALLSIEKWSRTVS